MQDAGDALWCFMVQREACGLRDPRPVLRDYRVPAEVRNRMGVFTGRRRHRRLSFAAAAADLRKFSVKLPLALVNRAGAAGGSVPERLYSPFSRHCYRQFNGVAAPEL